MPPPGEIVRRSLAAALCASLFTATATGQDSPGIRIVVERGEGAIHNISASSAVELSVQLRNLAGRPLARIPVTFQVPGTGPGGTFADGSNLLTVLSDSRGYASARGFRPNKEVGQFPVRVSAAFRGDTARATIMQTNAAPANANRFRRTILLVSLIGGAVFGAALLASAISNSNSQERRRRTPFDP